MIIFIGFSLVYIGFLWWSRFHWNRISVQAPPEPKKLTFSIIIPVRNEAENISQILSDLENQQYPKDQFEVILVDDHSEDSTLKMALQYLGQSNIQYQVVSLFDFGLTGKKQAITKGVERANFEIILSTDGDCHLPASWIQSYSKMYSIGDYQMVAGPVKMCADNFFTRIQAIEFAGLVGIGASSLQSGNPGMCNGANLSYKKSAFNLVNGYEGNFQVPSGDDEFLLQKIFKLYPESVGYLKDKEGIVETSAKPTFGELISQRLRWSSKWKYHKSSYIKAMAVLLFSNYISELVALGLVLSGVYRPELFIVIFALRWMTLYQFGVPIGRFFDHKSLFWYTLIIEIIYPFFVVFLGLASIFGHYSWKGRSYT